MFWITDGDWVLALTLFIIGNVGVAGSIVFYEALLPHLVGPKDLDRVSSAGYAIGYLGGGVLLAINAADDPEAGVFGIPTPGSATRLAFASVGIWWLVFSLPLLLRVPEPRALVSDNPQTVSLSGGFRAARRNVPRAAQVPPGAAVPGRVPHLQRRHPDDDPDGDDLRRDASGSTPAR